MKTIDDYRTRTISTAVAELSIEVTAPGFTYQYTLWVTKEFPSSTEEISKLVLLWVDQITPDVFDRNHAWVLQDL